MGHFCTPGSGSNDLIESVSGSETPTGTPLKESTRETQEEAASLPLKKIPLWNLQHLDYEVSRKIGLLVIRHLLAADM
jgi:hypothetical protein